MSDTSSGVTSDNYFDKGKFKAVELMKEIINEYKLIYVHELGFLVFNGMIWEKVNDNDINNIVHLKLKDETDDSRIKKTVNLIRYETNANINQLNKNTNRFVLLNGTLDISNWIKPIFYKNEFFEEDYCTVQLNCNYNPEAEHPEFKYFLETTFEGDSEIIRIVQEIMGYCLTTSTRYEKAFLFYGQGSNGKSVLINVFEKLLTSRNVASVSMSDLDNPFSRSALQNKLVNISSEQENAVNDTGYFKKVVSGDVIDAQFKFHDSFEFRPYCKMLFAMNKLPLVKDKSHGFYRRFITIPFNRVFAKEEQDKDLGHKLEQELDGILLFALEGLRRLAENDCFTESVKCSELLDIYKIECNPAEQFLKDTVGILSDSVVISKELFRKYSSFCYERNEKPIRDAEFASIVRNMFHVGKTRKRVDGKPEYVYEGLGYRSQIVETEDPSDGLIPLLQWLDSEEMKEKIEKKPKTKLSLDSNFDWWSD